MPNIKKGDKVQVIDGVEPMVASRDEYDNRVWLMTERDYLVHLSPNSPQGKEEPWLVLPDGSLIRDYQHGLPDFKG